MKKKPSYQSTPLWTAIITPLNKKGKIDFVSFKKLLKQQESAKNGIIILGSTGESMALTRKEKEAIVKFSTKQKLSVPLFVGVPGNQIEDTLGWIAFAKKQGIDGFLSVAPYYAKPGLKGQVAWFEQILNKAGKLPVMLYNVPSRTGVKIFPQVLSELKNHPNLWALKESSGSVQDFIAFRAANPKLAFYCGDDGLMPSFAKAGAIGLVSVASNAWPEATRIYVERCLAHQIDGLLPLWQQCTDTLFLASNPIPVKWLQYHLKMIPTPNTRLPLVAADLKDTKPIIEAHTKIKNWLSNA